MPGIPRFLLEPLYRNSLFLMANTGLVSLFNYVFWLLAGHMLSATHIGLSTEAISAAAMIVAVSRLGMDDSITRFFPQSKDPAGFYNALILITSLVTVVVIAGFVFWLPSISPALLFLDQWQYSLLFIGYIFLTSVCDLQGTALVAIRRADLALVQYSLLVLRIPLLLVVAPLGLLGVFVALDLTYLTMLIGGGILLYRTGISRDFRINLGEARRTIGFSLGNYVSTVISTAPATLVPILIVNVTGAKPEAYFYVAYTIATFLFMVPDSIAASMFVEGSHEQPLRATTLKSLRFAFAILAPLVVALLLFGDKVLQLFSPEYIAPAHQLLQLLAISSLFYAAVVVYVTVEQVRQNLAMLNFVRLAVSGLTIGLSFILLVKIGLAGIGYAWLVANGVVAAIAGWRMLSKKNW